MGGADSGEGSTGTSQPCFRRQVREVQLPPPRWKKGKPNIVGHRSIRGLLQGVVQGVKESDYMGSELLQDATDKVLRGVAKTHHFRGFLNGDGRIRMDFIQGERKGLRVYAARLNERQAFPPDTEASFAVCLAAQQLCQGRRQDTRHALWKLLHRCCVPQFGFQPDSVRDKRNIFQKGC